MRQRGIIPAKAGLGTALVMIKNQAIVYPDSSTWSGACTQLLLRPSIVDDTRFKKDAALSFVLS